MDQSVVKFFEMIKSDVEKKLETAKTDEEKADIIAKIAIWDKKIQEAK